MLMKIRRVALAGALVALTTAPVLAEEAVDTLAREDATEAQVDAEIANQNALQAQQDAAQAQDHAAQAQQGVSSVSGGLVALELRVAALEALGLPGSGVSDIDVVCVDDDTVQGAVDLATPGTPLLVTIFGTCGEDVWIKKDDITLQGFASDGTDGIEGEVTIVGARRTKFENMTISGGASGITAYDGAVLRAKDVTVTGTTGTEGYNGYGVGSYQGAVVVLTNVDVSETSGFSVQAGINGMVEIREGSEIVNDSDREDVSAVHAYDRSFVRIRGDVTVLSTTGYGLLLSGSTVRIQEFLGGKPDIASQSTDGEHVAVFIHRGSNARIEDATISATSGRALMIHTGSSASVRRSEISSSNPSETVLVNKGSTVELSNNTITNTSTDIDAWRAAVAVVNDSSVAFFSRTVSSPVPPGNTLTTDGVAVGVIYASHVQQNGKHDTFNGDFDIFGNSSAEFQDAEINGNMEVSHDSWLRLRNQSTSSSTIVTGNIQLWADSLLSFKAPDDGSNKVQIDGNVNCGDEESSVAWNPDRVEIVGGGTPDCSDFNPTPHTH